MYANTEFETRMDYLRDLAYEYGIDTSTVFMLADMLGPNEDFDGLVTSLQDIEAGCM